MKHLLITILAGCAIACHAPAQNYRAVQGSPYAGSLGVHNNPASIVQTPYKWDLTLLGVQAQGSTNALKIYDFSYLSSPANSKYGLSSGNYARYARLSANVNLFNARIAIGRKQAISFGINIRSYTNITTSRYSFIDTLQKTGPFFAMNAGTNDFNLNMASSSWIEWYGSYARTLYEDELGRLNGGITVRLGRGLSGAYVQLDGGRFSTVVQNNRPVYMVTDARLTYGYSSNYDRWQKENSTTANLADFFRYTEGGASLDLGLEYLVKPQEVSTIYDDDDYYDYTWKLGISLLHVGASQYKYGSQSRNVSGVKANVTNASLDRVFDSTITSLAVFNDSLAAVAGQSSAIGGRFNIVHPMRLVLNADRYLTKAFFVNAEMSLNVPNAFMKHYLQVRELNFITITPRWETRRWGVYLPIQFNSQHQLWVGGAFKAGPLLLGFHNWANLFSSRSTQNGGGYIALTLHSADFTAKKPDRRLNCPR